MVAVFSTPVEVRDATDARSQCRVCGRHIAVGEVEVRWVIGEECYWRDTHIRYMHAHFNPCWFGAGGAAFISVALQRLSDEQLRGMGLEVETPEPEPEADPDPDWWRSLQPGERLRVTDITTHPSRYGMGVFTVGQILEVDRVRDHPSSNRQDIHVRRRGSSDWWIYQDSVERVT